MRTGFPGCVKFPINRRHQGLATYTHCSWFKVLPPKFPINRRHQGLATWKPRTNNVVVLLWFPINRRHQGLATILLEHHQLLAIQSRRAVLAYQVNRAHVPRSCLQGLRRVVRSSDPVLGGRPIWPCDLDQPEGSEAPLRLVLRFRPCHSQRSAPTPRTKLRPATSPVQLSTAANPSGAISSTSMVVPLVTRATQALASKNKRSGCFKFLVRYLSALLSARDALLSILTQVYCALLFMGHA